MPVPTVIATSLSPKHAFSKLPHASLNLIAGFGIEGDAHAGSTTQHLYRRRMDPAQPNLTQVHLLHAELLDTLDLQPGQLGENLTTRHLDLHSLPTRTLLDVGSVRLEVTGYRTPCSQIDRLRPNLMKAVFRDKRPNAGIMAIVVASGTIRPGDPIVVTLPPEPHVPLGPV